nr:hypothetical protein [Mycobacterium riyadhense]
MAAMAATAAVASAGLASRKTTLIKPLYVPVPLWRALENPVTKL